MQIYIADHYTELSARAPGVCAFPIWQAVGTRPGLIARDVCGQPINGWSPTYFAQVRGTHGRLGWLV